MRIIKFSIVGLSGIIVNLVGFYAASTLLAYTPLASSSSKLALNISISIGIILSIFTNYHLHCRFTWNDRIAYNSPFAFKRFVKFFGASWVGILLQFLVGNYFLSLSLDPKFGVFVGILLGSSFNFLFNTSVTFKKDY